MVGLLRELDDERDPHRDNRRGMAADAMKGFLPETDVWRDSRDKELWTQFQNRTFGRPTKPTADVDLWGPWGGRPPLTPEQEKYQQFLNGLVEGMQHPT